MALAVAGVGAIVNRHAIERRQRSGDAPPGRSVVVIVLDTVRRDHATPCGADSGLTPNLAALAGQGLTLCNLVVPGSWTLPVHASLFTGLPVAEHGADFSFDGQRAGEIFDPNLLIRPLDERFRTLAEEASEAGLATTLISGNPMLAPALGLAQGFDQVSVDGNFHPARIGYLWRRMANLETHRPPGSDHFLFVNISLAHDPFEFPPGAVDETTGRPLTGNFRLYNRADPMGGLAVRAETDPSGELAREMAPVVRRAYEWGVRQADRDLGLILGALRGRGLIDPRSTIVVTSDHGEFLGEGGRFDHCRSVAHELVDSFAVVVSPGVEAGSRSEALVQTQDLTTLLRPALRGVNRFAQRWLEEVERRRSAAWAVSLPDPRFFHRTSGRFGRTFHVGVRSSAGEAQWFEDVAPGAGQRLAGAVGDDALRSALASEARRTIERLRDWTSLRPEALDAELRASLQAAGYL